ncbi:helix-turn-helix domain-containing protein (plasmid) [Coraliomargarita sp. W4R53]
MTTESRPRFYFVDEVAQELRRSTASVRWMIHTKQINTGKIGGRTVISAREIDRILAEAFTEAS